MGHHLGLANLGQSLGNVGFYRCEYIPFMFILCSQTQKIRTVSILWDMPTYPNIEHFNKEK